MGDVGIYRPRVPTPRTGRVRAGRRRIIAAQQAAKPGPKLRRPADRDAPTVGRGLEGSGAAPQGKCRPRVPPAGRERGPVSSVGEWALWP